MCVIALSVKHILPTYFSIGIDLCFVSSDTKSKIMIIRWHTITVENNWDKTPLIAYKLKLSKLKKKTKTERKTKKQKLFNYHPK